MFYKKFVLLKLIIIFCMKFDNYISEMFIFIFKFMHKDLL